MQIKKTFKFACFLLIFCIHVELFTQEIETFYGPLTVEEPVIIELLESQPVQRLKHVYQYGNAHYTNLKEEYTRYDHSVGVFAILRIKGASPEEQIAGLLHDVSHTVFSHVGDLVFNIESEQDSFQDNIHRWFLETYGIDYILKKYGLTIAQISHKSGRFLALEQELPDLCADRIDYNLQGAYHRGYITKVECKEILDDLQFVDGKWISTKPQLIKKIVFFSLDMTQNYWGSADGYMTSKWLANAINTALKNKEISSDDIFFGTDNTVWEKLNKSKDPRIRENMKRITEADHFFSLVDVDKADLHIHRKFRGIDPWIRQKDNIVRLTAIDDAVAKEYQRVKDIMEQGWGIIERDPQLLLEIR